MDISFKLELHAVTVLWTERYNSNEFQCQLQESVLQNKETLQNSTRCSVIAALPLWLTLTSSKAANIKHVTQFIVTNRRNTANNINLNCTFHIKVYYYMKSQYNFHTKLSWFYIYDDSKTFHTSKYKNLINSKQTTYLRHYLVSPTNTS